MKSYIGIDWSEKKHCVHIYNRTGALVARKEVPHNQAGFAQLHRLISQVNPVPADCLVAIETAHNLLVDFLQEHGYAVYILAPNFVSSNRGRLGSSGAKDDERDAQLLADILRTDHGRLIRWQPDGAAVRQMRVLLGFIDDLTKQIVAQHNRLRAGLLRYYPQPVTAFSNLQAPLVLTLLATYPDPAQFRSVSQAEFAAFCRAQRYYRADRYPLLWQQLRAEMPAADPALRPVLAQQTAMLADMLLSLVRQKQTGIQQVRKLFDAHPDAPIFSSIPGAGDLLAPKLLVMFGEHRERYPHRQHLPAIAGTCPVTIASGQSRVVKFRRACNRAYRTTAQQLANASVTQSPWAATYLDRLLADGKSRSHALRCLANRWLHIIWTLWQRRELYDESYHLQQVERHRRPR
jgi:transposase